MKLHKSETITGLKIPRGESITGSMVRLRGKKLTDVRNDYRWQSDPELAKLDGAPPLTASFPAYILDYTDSIHRPGLNRYPMAIETFEGKHIGNCTCYDIDDDRGELQLGIMIGNGDYLNKGYGNDTVKTLVDHVFHNTEMNRIYLKTLDWNYRAQKCFQNCGFTMCGKLSRNGKTFLFMDINREQWQSRQVNNE
jgi:ribosomal-protein-alanine N-acetyltransferase